MTAREPTAIQILGLIRLANAGDGAALPIGAPHAPQNRASDLTSFPHCLQYMSGFLLGLRWRSLRWFHEELSLRESGYLLQGLLEIGVVVLLHQSA